LLDDLKKAGDTNPDDASATENAENGEETGTSRARGAEPGNTQTKKAPE